MIENNIDHSETQEEKKILGLNPNVFFVGITSFLTDTTTKMIYAVMPMFLLSLGGDQNGAFPDRRDRRKYCIRSESIIGLVER